jgi:hypothetical protein
LVPVVLVVKLVQLEADQLQLELLQRKVEILHWVLQSHQQAAAQVQVKLVQEQPEVQVVVEAILVLMILLLLY